MKFILATVVASFIVGTIYLGVASFTWQIRNPKANPTTFITFFTDVVAFNKLETFQAN